MSSMQEMQEIQVPSLGLEDPLEELMATHSSILAEKSRGQRTLVSYNRKGHKESDRTEHTLDTIFQPVKTLVTFFLVLNFILFLMFTISCYEVTFGNDTEQDPVGLPGTKAFLFLLFLDLW